LRGFGVSGTLGRIGLVKRPILSDKSDLSRLRGQPRKGNGVFRPSFHLTAGRLFFLHVMSIRVLSSAWNTKCETHTQKLILLNLADHSNDCGVCWPSLDRIATQCGMCKNTVISQLKRLETQGMLAVTRSTGGSRNPNRYRLIIEELKTLNSFEVFRPKENGATALNRSTVHSRPTNGATALVPNGATALHSNRHEPPIEPPTGEAGPSSPASARNGKGSSFNSQSTFWENRARLDLVERGIKEIEDRASVCAMETIIEPRDRAKLTKLREQRRDLKKALDL
jgi:hypothetical protein